MTTPRPLNPQKRKRVFFLHRISSFFRTSPPQSSITQNTNSQAQVLQTQPTINSSSIPQTHESDPTHAQPDLNSSIPEAIQLQNSSSNSTSRPNQKKIHESDNLPQPKTANLEAAEPHNDTPASERVCEETEIETDHQTKASSHLPQPPHAVEPPVAGPSSMFPGAHNFKIEGSQFQIIHGNQIIYRFDGMQLNDQGVRYLENFFRDVDHGGTVLLILDKKRVVGAEVDSSARDPPPRCHPETRKELLLSLNSWLVNDNRRWTFLWLSGPAGSGKSAVAQTFAERASKNGRLGAAFFFSKLQHRDSPDGVIATIAFQLAKCDAFYNYLITNILYRDPSIVDKSLRAQFHELIVNPLAILAGQPRPGGTARKPLVVIIDGLDECSNEFSQKELINLISEYVESSKAGPTLVLWLLCCRPEWHLKREFAQAQLRIDFNREEITCNAAEDISDVYRILKDGLQKIHCDLFSSGPGGSQWPTETKLQQLSRSVGGLPVLADVVLRFVRDGLNPNVQLDICIWNLENVSEAMKIQNPLAALDVFYGHIMSRVLTPIPSIVNQIITFYILSSSYTDPVMKLAFEVIRFFGIDRESFYSNFRHLHSVIDIPPAESAHELPLKFFHKSFPDFLQDPTRSKSFALDVDQARYDIASITLRWHNYFLQTECKVDHCSCMCDESALAQAQLPWIDDIGSSYEHGCLRRIENFATNNCWDICTSLNDSRLSGIISELTKFNYCHIPSLPSSQYEKQFSRFLKWLTKYMQDDTDCGGLIRFKPASEFDEILEARLNTTSLTLHLRRTLPPNITEIYRPYNFISTHLPVDTRANPILMGIWIGKEERTALALLKTTRREGRSYLT